VSACFAFHNPRFSLRSPLAFLPDTMWDSASLKTSLQIPHQARSSCRGRRQVSAASADKRFPTQSPLRCRRLDKDTATSASVNVKVHMPIMMPVKVMQAGPSVQDLRGAPRVQATANVTRHTVHDSNEGPRLSYTESSDRKVPLGPKAVLVATGDVARGALRRGPLASAPGCF
jgi:hypothetical protein